MRKFLVALVATLAIPAAAAAEKPNFDRPGTLGADGALVLPFGDLGEYAGLGIGAMLHYDRPFWKKLSLTARTGYIYFGGQDYDGWETSYSMIPMMVGGKWDLAKVPGLYVGAELGYTVVTATWETDNEILGHIEEDHSATDFGSTVGIGYKKDNFDFGARFWLPDWGSTSVMVSAGYNFTSF